MGSGVVGSKAGWQDDEPACASLADKRLVQRPRRLLDQLSPRRVSWRLFFVTMLARAKPDAPPDTVLTTAEIKALDHIDAARFRPRLQRRTLAAYLLQIAMLGGYLARNHDPSPGTMVVCHGLTRLYAITVGASIGAGRRCG